MAEIIFTNRVKQSETIKSQLPVLAGVWLVKGSEVEINNQSVEKNDFLLPDIANSASIKSPNELSQVIPQFPFDQFPIDIERDSILGIARQIKNLENANSTWDEWVKISPLVGGIPTKATLTSFEILLAESSQHLSEIAWRPQQQLKVEIERMPVGRARRIPARAQEYLSHHTEDWEYPKFSSVIPRRVLSTIPDDLLDFYENRLWAKLVSVIEDYLRKRRKQFNAFDLLELQRELGTSQRRRRIVDLYAVAVSEENLSSTIKENLQIIEGLLRQARSWVDTQLYKAIPHQSRNSLSTYLRSSNILDNDRHYRFVSLLWREFKKTQHEQVRTNIQVQQELQELCHGFDRFSVLIILRALQQLGYTPAYDIVIKPGIQFELHRKSGDLKLAWQEDGNIEIFTNQKLILRLIPLIIPLALGQTTDNIIAKLDYLEKLAENQSVIFLYPGKNLEIASLPLDLQKRINGPGNDRVKPGKVGFIPISPYDLGSIERVGRSLRWFIFGSLYLSYPPRIRLPFSYKDQIIQKAKWLQPVNKDGSANILKLPKQPDEIGSWDNYLSTVLGTLNNKPDINSQQINLLKEFKKNLESGFGKLRQLSCCPICDSEIVDENFHQTDDNFSCTCNTCKIRWGTLVCGLCHERYPFLQFNKFSDQNRSTVFTPTWVENVFGMDILAVPCQANSMRYICPNCGYCEHLTRHTESDCMSCRGLIYPE